MTADEIHLLRHVLATLAYRTRRALRCAPAGFDAFDAGHGVRTPAEIVSHMTSVLGYARTYFVGGVYRPEPVADLEKESRRFHGVLADLSRLLADGTSLRRLSTEQLLQGPLSDAMTHAGQLAMLRRLAGSPVASENFIFADISTEDVGPEQPLPAAPSSRWLGVVVHTAWRLSTWLNGRRRS